MNSFDQRLLIAIAGILVAGVWVRTVLMPMRSPARTQEIIIEGVNGQMVTPAPVAPVELPCEQEAIIL
ncbi:MAG: hypothetical protein MH825_13105 [Cyanobacteria bacterium]|nr:hypothetical protein [Cyanobacteriota bacterium]